MTDLSSLAKRLLSRRERDNLATSEWNEIADCVGSDLAIDRAALAAECERLRKEVARLEGLLRSQQQPSAVGTGDGWTIVPAGCSTCPRRT